MWKLYVGIVLVIIWFLYGEFMNFTAIFPMAFREKREFGLSFLASGLTSFTLYFIDKAGIWQGMLISSMLTAYIVAMIFISGFIENIEFKIYDLNYSNKKRLRAIGTVHCISGSVFCFASIVPLLLALI